MTLFKDGFFALKRVVSSLFSGNIKYTLFVAVLFFSASGLVGYYQHWSRLVDNCKGCDEHFLWSSTSFLNLMENGLIGLGTSTLAAALISVVSSIQFQRQVKLAKLLGAVIGSSRKVCICLPEFGANYFINNNREEATIASSAPTVPVGSYDDFVTGISKVDLLLTTKLVSLLQDQGFGLPDVLTHVQVNRDSLTKRDFLKRYSSIICVGTFSNDISMDIPFVSFSGREAEDHRTRTITVETADGEVASSPILRNCCDLAVFLRRKLNVQGVESTLITLGGLNASGTQALSNFFYKEWLSEICETQVGHGQNRRSVLEEEKFIIVYDVQGNLKHFDETAKIKAGSFWCPELDVK